MIIMQYGEGQQPVSWHVHETRPPQYVRIYLMDGGSVTYRDAVLQQPLKQGRLYVFPAQQAYELTHQPEDPISCLWMHADVLPYIVRHLIEIDPAQHPEIAETLKLWRCQVRRSAENNACAEAFGMALLQLLVRDGFLSEMIDRRLIEPMMQALDAGVGAVSRSIGYTEEHFIRLFSQTVGVTPYQYILSQRMNEAIQLLRQGVQMEEIAARTGYASGKSFAGAFKRWFGIAPSVYRAYFLKRA